MPAIPREWTFSVTGVGGTVTSIVIPAGGPGVRHVLTQYDVSIVTNPAGAAAFVAFEVVDGVTSLGSPFLLGVTGIQGEIDRDSWSGIYIGSPATAMTVRSSLPPANVTPTIRILGHDQ